MPYARPPCYDAAMPEADQPVVDPQPVDLLGVRYWHSTTPGGGDLYLTAYGRPYRNLLHPENWREDTWFTAQRERLAGTSVVYRIPTRAVGGRQLDLVVKWCRVGEEIPYDTQTFQKFTEAEFNGPYEEFSLLMELRNRPGPHRLRTTRPLGIYVPGQQLKLWQTGRLRSKMEQHQAKYRDIELDMFRQYILIYQWVRGVAAVDALDRAFPDPADRRRELERLTVRAHDDLAARGFFVIDHKPVHLILRTRRDGSLLRDPSTGEPAYALVDFELLNRTPEHHRRVQTARRASYLRGQRDRFVEAPDAVFPPHLRPAEIFCVRYVCGAADSTHGMLWVVGCHPELFEFFLPERWRRTPRRLLSATNETFFTRTKDQIQLVWKVSRVGERPELDPDTPEGGRLLAHGYNSPFEEFSLALALAAKGLPTTYPRAIYMCGIESDRPADYAPDLRRYESHRSLHTPDGRPLLSTEHNYLTVWGFWNGLDESLAERDEPMLTGISLANARSDGFITAAEAGALMPAIQARLRAAGYEELAPKPTHYLLSLKPDNTLVREPDGSPQVRICNFASIRRILNA